MFCIQEQGAAINIWGGTDEANTDNKISLFISYDESGWPVKSDLAPKNESSKYFLLLLLTRGQRSAVDLCLRNRPPLKEQAQVHSNTN